MKKLIYAGLVTVGFSVLAAGGLTVEQAQDAVLAQAHRYISESAPDWGGHVHSPCGVNLEGDRYTVTCSGIASETTGGDGSVDIHFKCVGNFAQGHDGLFFKDGAIHCSETN